MRERTKASELIKDLENLIDHHGDQHCVIDEHGYFDIQDVSYFSEKSRGGSSSSLEMCKPYKGLFLIK